MNERNELSAVRNWAVDYIADHPTPDFFVGYPDDHQLQRWFIIPRNKVMNVYLHRFLRDDDDRALHDHPWDNHTWVLDGEYDEILGAIGGRHRRRTGDTVQRAAALPHRVELINEQPAITLFLTGPVIREWGFYCPSGWRHWREFVTETPGGNHRGRGCE